MFSRTCDILMNESGCRLDHPAATKFKLHVMDGDWSKADHDLQDLRQLIPTSNNILVKNAEVVKKASESISLV